MRDRAAMTHYIGDDILAEVVAGVRIGRVAADGSDIEPAVVRKR